MAVPKVYLAAVKAASQKYNVPAELLAAQIQAESGWNKDAKSPAGATGISQFMPGTAKGMGIDPHDPIASIDAQGKMMGRLIKSYGGNEDKALAAYNAGAGAVAKYGGVPPYKETQNYIKNIHSYESNYPGLSKDAVLKAVQYNNIIKDTSSKASQTASKPLSLSPLGDSSSGAYNPSQALTDYLLKQSTAGPGNDDPTAQLMTLLSNNQASIDIQTSKGTTSVPVLRESTTSVDPAEAKIVSDAKQYLGVKYKWGGTDPKGGFDCSGFVQYVNNLNGIKIPRTTYQQLKAGTPVEKKDLQPGDAVFFHNGSHEGMYIGNGKFIQAPHTGDVVKISDLDTYKGYFGARRFGK